MFPAVWKHLIFQSIIFNVFWHLPSRPSALIMSLIFPSPFLSPHLFLPFYPFLHFRAPYTSSLPFSDSLPHSIPCPFFSSPSFFPSTSTHLHHHHFILPSFFSTFFSLHPSSLPLFSLIAPLLFPPSFIPPSLPPFLSVFHSHHFFSLSLSLHTLHSKFPPLPSPPVFSVTTPPLLITISLFSPSSPICIPPFSFPVHRSLLLYIPPSVPFFLLSLFFLYPSVLPLFSSLSPSLPSFPHPTFAPSPLTVSSISPSLSSPSWSGTAL